MAAWGWPSSTDELIALQGRLAEAAAAVAATDRWSWEGEPVIGGCFVAFARGEAGPGAPGDRGWAGAVAWRCRADRPRVRRPGLMLRGRVQGRDPRRSRDVEAQAVAAGRVAAAYQPGLLALREGPLLAEAVTALTVRPDVLLVDATGLDHPRRAGLAIHLGAVCELPTVGVTHRPLLGRGDPPPLVRGQSAPVHVEGEAVGRWVCTRTGARPVVAHAGWRTDAAIAAEVVLLASTESARTPVPLQEARRVAREARALAGAG